MNLIGLKYPVTDLDNNEVAFRRIKDVIDSENSAGCMLILIKDSKSGIYIGYAQAMKLIERNENNEFDKLKDLD